MKLKKGDRVKVLSGKDRGEVGEVMRAIPQRDMVIVDGVNVSKKSQRAVRATMQTGIIDKDMPPRWRWSAPTAPGPPASATGSTAMPRFGSAASAEVTCEYDRRSDA